MNETSAIVPIIPAVDTTIALTDYRPNGLGHIGILGGLTVAGFQIFALTTSPLMIIPFAGVGIYTLIRNAKYGRSPDWIAARDAIFSYRFAGQLSLGDAYPGWCQQYGKQLVNSIIEPMIGQVVPYDFLKDKRHPYHGAKGVFCYNDPEDGIVPLTPWHYVDYKLKAMNSIADRAKAIDTSPEAIHKLSAAIKADQDKPTIDVLGVKSGGDAEELPNLPVGTPKLTNCPTVASLLGVGFCKPLQPMLILGAPGAGKGMYSAYALSFAATKHQAEVWVIDPKSALSEAGYWQYVARHYLKDGNLKDPKLGSDILSVVEEFEQRVSDRKNDRESTDKPLILFIDEVNTIASKMSKSELSVFGPKVVSLASQARSQNAAIWLGGQCAILELLGIKGVSNRDIFDQVVCVYGAQTSKAQAILSNLGIDKSLLSGLTPDRRYWVTPGGVVTAPDMTELVADGWGANVIDLRPGGEETESVEGIGSDVERHPDEGPETVLYSGAIFELIQSLMPNVGDRLTCRDLKRNLNARKLGVTSENAESLLKELAMERGDRFGWFEDELKTGSVTKGLTRIRPE